MEFDGNQVPLMRGYYCGERMKFLIINFLKKRKETSPFLRGSIRFYRQFRLSVDLHLNSIRNPIRCYLYDFCIGRKYLSWKRKGISYQKLSSELIFQYHKLEKGLCLPGKKRFFGVDALNATIRLMEEWMRSGFPTDHPVYVASCETLRAYLVRMDVAPPPENLRFLLVQRIEAVLAGSQPDATRATPIMLPAPRPEAFNELFSLARARRSVRHFSDHPVNFSYVEKALSIAQLSPSACNRQPYIVHFYEKKDHIIKMLELQNGNNGFRDNIPLLAVITTDMNCFFDVSERIEPILDGGIFLMLFLLSLQSVGLSSCCLNWCVLPESDIKAHRIGNIPKNHQILTFLAIGHAADKAIVPLSARRPMEDIIVRH